MGPSPVLWGALDMASCRASGASTGLNHLLLGTLLLSRDRRGIRNCVTRQNGLQRGGRLLLRMAMQT
eukprot:4042067-Pyramimonas_sp.AAC.1